MFVRKSTSLSGILEAILLVSIVFVVLQVHVVNAAPITINVSPSSAPVGDIITVAGVNATAGAEVRIYVVGFLFLTTTTANATGGYSVDVTVPAVPSDIYTIMAQDVADGDTASTTLTVEPRITLSPNQGGYNSEVFIRGDGFQPNDTISILFDGVDVTPGSAPQTDFVGSFKASFYVIQRPNGTYTVTAMDTWIDSASANFTVVSKIFVWPKTSSSPATLAFVEGYGFDVSVNVTVHFGSIDVTPYPWLTTDGMGYFGVPFFVPDVPDGIYMLEAADVSGNSASIQYVVPSPILTLTPSRVSESSLVTARGYGFSPRSAILLYLEDVTMTHFIDLMWMSPNLMAKEDGTFEYSFIVPVTQPGVYAVSAYAMSGPPPAPLDLEASAPLTIVDDAPLDIDVNVGSTHFRGEMAEFYVKTAFGGDLVNAKIDSARLYYRDGNVSLDLLSGIKTVALGLQRIPYAILDNASQGTYILVVTSHFYADAVEAYGTASGSFLISPTLTDANAQLIDINDQIGTVIIPDLGVIRVNLTAINARLVSVQGTEATIQSDIGTLKTTTDAINAEVTSIDGDVATISSELGTVKSHVTTTGFQLDLGTLVVALVAAAGSVVLFLFVRKMRSPTPMSSSSPTPPPSGPAEPVVSTQATNVSELQPSVSTETPVAPLSAPPVTSENIDTMGSSAAADTVPSTAPETAHEVPPETDKTQETQP